MDLQCLVNYSQQKMSQGKGAFIHYVRVFWGFLEPPTPYVRTFSLHGKTAIFLPTSNLVWLHFFSLFFCFRRFVDVLENIKSYRLVRPKTTERRTNIGVTRRNSDGRYGNLGCQVFNGGIQNYMDF